MKNKKVILLGSSRSNGDTKRIVDYLNIKNEFDIIDLKAYKISYFDYEHENANDDFIPLMEKVVSNYDIIVFATPVYWYNMSGIMKVFFDRISDLLNYRKDIGRKLRGKSMAMVSVSNANDLKEGFNMPFIESANYLGMKYLGDTHAWVENQKISKESKGSLDIFSLLI